MPVCLSLHMVNVIGECWFKIDFVWILNVNKCAIARFKFDNRLLFSVFIICSFWYSVFTTVEYGIWKLNHIPYTNVYNVKNLLEPGIRYNGKSLSERKVYSISICQVNKFMGSDIWHLFCILRFLKEPNSSNPKFFPFLSLYSVFVVVVILHWITHNLIHIYSIYMYFPWFCLQKSRWMKHWVQFSFLTSSTPFFPILIHVNSSRNWNHILHSAFHAFSQYLNTITARKTINHKII